MCYLCACRISSVSSCFPCDVHANVSFLLYACHNVLLRFVLVLLRWLMFLRLRVFPCGLMLVLCCCFPERFPSLSERFPSLSMLLYERCDCDRRESSESDTGVMLVRLRSHICLSIATLPRAGHSTRRAAWRPGSAIASAWLLGS